jgi:hypothetical protein
MRKLELAAEELQKALYTKASIEFKLLKHSSVDPLLLGSAEDSNGTDASH